jgi:hypothetical protein
MKPVFLRCIDVIDHGHCATTTFESDDQRARLSLYTVAEDRPYPAKGAVVQLRPHDETQFALEEELAADLRFFGISFARRNEDGSIERVDPRNVFIKTELPAPVPDPVPTLFPADHPTQLTPPVDNAHVEEGCEQFDEQLARLDDHGAEPHEETTEAVTSLDTPGQILGAAAEEPHSD